MKKASLLLLGLITLVSAACKDAGSSGRADEIVIGEYASLTGGTASFGQSSNKGTRMAVEEINASGGLLGKKVKLITEDDQSKAGEAATVARKLISREKVVALLGEVASSKSLEAAPIAQEKKIPMISPASTNPKVTEVGDYVFRICFIDPFQGTVMSKFALGKEWKRVAILTDVKQDYSVGLSQFFKEHFTTNGGTIVSEQSYSSGDTDFSAQLTSIRGAAPEAILASGYYTEAGLIAKQARQLGLTVPLLGGDGWDSPSLVEVGGAAMEGNFFSNHFSPEDQSPIVQDFLKKVRAKYNVEADAMMALGYDSAMLLADAIKRAGTTEPAKLRDAIATTKDFAGVTGTITINEQRNATKPAVILTIREGKFRYVETVTP
ncbi:MAG: ABC transporter substrate-binding protein [Verrucomicrobiota bacterium]|nr:ABC transporter substrate-binding protein [Verrucomicrobiota bacterium]